ncbi:MAG: hypothetical protein V8S08_07290 [Lachnoclostridium sp.]
MVNLVATLAPLIVGINGVILIANEIISYRKEKEEEKYAEHKEIKERWKRVS